ncbi:Non-specific serine/threonine protein kinase [Purpureocillium takamizusanense]|uniref:non-specific serine/threonine protein kinase n=1 Tax=Purpureocillium takamizusanense TaxID=2060973 RepID=A0A9Q8QJT8_9HYPO|nr:Non-specific serine/threonine protein kinase [Purpureocillium takamizusanense]UNI20940.1 Non-specific serine/threonine protein kinase [Purpureocillium takamizusanense]
MPGDRHNHSSNGRAAPAGVASVAVSRDRGTPGTPSRKERVPRESSALQDPGLKDYRLGECLGKGAFGSVYKAFNWSTGEAVAVKQIKLADLPKSELRMIESEIDLLKNLLHDNIVKYIGFVKSTDCLNIILEYCENGSLHSILKAYGKFPENLVGVYMTQVLQGLQYLHDQGVIHRDIKGANILTTKDGTVKLADFGVSTSTLAGGQDKEAQVVGTPYWMAPEIIQLSGASSASDIWSVGCTVIELLQGKPPYHNLAAMPALFAIVNDDHPPLPEGISAAARDFLMQCFQKDPNLRVTARKLLRHAWIAGSRRAEAPVSKAPANFNQAVEEVKQWNKALNSDSNLRTSIGSEFMGPSSRFIAGGTPARGPLSLAKSRPAAEAFKSAEVANDDNWDDDFATAISPSALQLPHLKPQDNFGGLLSSDKLKAFASSSDGRTDSSNYDDDFEGELLTIKGPSSRFRDIDSQEHTIRPLPKKTVTKAAETPKHHRTKAGSGKQPLAISSGPSVSRSPPKAHLGSIFELPPRPDVVYREQSTEDFSDLFVDNDSLFGRGVNPAVNKGARATDAPQLFHPSDLTSLPRSMQAPDGSIRKKSQSRPSVLPDRPMRRTRSSIEIQKFAEDDDEDFSDVFGASDSHGEKEESERGSEDGGLMLMSKMSSSSWLGDDEDEFDPFATMDPGWDEMDLEANIARDRHARLAERVEDLVASLKTTEGEDMLSDLSEDLLALLWEHKEVKTLIISAHGLLPILEILEPCTVKSRQYMILQLLKVVNAIILDDVEIQENLCFVGGIPIITKFAARQYSDEIRLEAAAFVRQMYQTSTLTLQMFVSAGGLNVLVEFLDEDYDSARDLVLIGVNGIWNVFELQGPTPKNDFCRIFSRSKILYPLALVLHRVLDEEGEDELGELIEGRIVNIFYLFSQAENYVKEMVADRQVLKSVLKDLRRMTPVHQITMLKFIKNLSMLSTTIESLHSADAIEFLIDLLSYSMKKDQKHFREISNQVLNTLFNLCRLSKERQEDAAVGGIIPLLLRIMKTARPPKEFALPILCDMAHSGSKGRRYLWQNKGLAFYVTLLTDQYWQVTALDAILVWLQEETANVESHLVDGHFTRAIVSCFGTNRLNAFDSNLLEPLLKLLRLSPSVAASLAKPEMFAGIAQRLGHKKAVVRLNLLRLVRTIMDSCEPGLGTGDGSRTLNNAQIRSLMNSIQTLAETDTAVLVRNLAAELLRSHIEMDSSVGHLLRHDGPSAAQVSSASSSARRSATRRNTSYTPPSFQSSVSMPQTPTSRSRQSLVAGNAYIEVAASPRRSNTTLDRESLMYRPRSRDGPTQIPRRVSGDASSLGGSSSSGTTVSSGAKSRLPRTSLAPMGIHSSGRHPGPSASRASEQHVSHHHHAVMTPMVVRSESSTSNKENGGSSSRASRELVSARDRDRDRDGAGGGVVTPSAAVAKARRNVDNNNKW